MVKYHLLQSKCYHPLSTKISLYKAFSHMKSQRPLKKVGLTHRKAQEETKVTGMSTLTTCKCSLTNSLESKSKLVVWLKQIRELLTLLIL